MYGFLIVYLEMPFFFVLVVNMDSWIVNFVSKGELLINLETVVLSWGNFAPPGTFSSVWS